MRCCAQRFLCRVRRGQFVYAENQGEGEGEVVGRLERCAGGWRSVIPLLYGRSYGAVRDRRAAAKGLASLPPSSSV